MVISAGEIPGGVPIRSMAAVNGSPSARRQVAVVGGCWTGISPLGGRSIARRREAPHRVWMSVMGILSIVAGLILLAYPGISLLVLYVIVSIWLLVFGFMEISVAFQVRSASHRVGGGREAHAT
jgi:hypothetical protein